MVADADLRPAIDVEHAQLNGLRARRVGGTLAVVGAERQRVGLAVGDAVVDDVLVGRPFEAAAGGVERGAGWRVLVMDQAQVHGIAVGVAGEQGERQRLVFVDQLQRDRRDAWRLVVVGHGDFDVADKFRRTVAGGDAEVPESSDRFGFAAVLRGKPVGCPAERRALVVSGERH